MSWGGARVADHRYRDLADAIILHLIDADLPSPLFWIGWLDETIDTEHCRPARHDRRKDLSNALRFIVAWWDEQVLAFEDGRGTYRIVDLERYFDDPAPGMHDRWRRSYMGT